MALSLGGLLVLLLPPLGASQRNSRLPIANGDAPDIIPNSYIVVWNSDMGDAAIDAIQTSWSATIKKRNLGRRSLDGAPLSTEIASIRMGSWRAMALDADESTIMSMSSAPEVAYIEADHWMTISAPIDTPQVSQCDKSVAQSTVVRPLSDAVEPPIGAANLPTESINPTGEPVTEPNGPVKTPNAVLVDDTTGTIEPLIVVVNQVNTTVGLARISHASTKQGGYLHDPKSGLGVTVYIIDTGINPNHVEFEGRASIGLNLVDNINTDENGHGSHCAGTIGGRSVGVAKQCTLVGVKVLDKKGRGRNSVILRGMQWIQDQVIKEKLGGKAIVNMSISGSKSRTTNTAVEKLDQAGIYVIVAAGNDNKDARDSSPASAPEAITIAAMDANNDTRASFSNCGPAVDFYGPGVKVTSVDAKDENSFKNLSGTSMATPHAAGLAATLIDENITNSRQLVAKMRRLAAQTGAQVKKNPKDTSGLILNNGNAQ